jgi:2-oxoisovalerate dehydrogenase E2 component (dihydrolipoyl transacylase)
VAKVTMPQLGESVAEGTIGKWLKEPGDHVDKYEPLLEVITDKVNAEVPSPFEGTLKEILAQEGDTVPNNAEIAIIETAADGAGEEKAEAPPVDKAVEESEAPAADSKAEPAAAEPAHGPAGSDERPAREAAAASAGSAPTAAAKSGDGDGPGNPDARMTPAVRRLLREHNLSPAAIVGTGSGGRITREDVLNFVESGGAAAGANGQQPAAADAPAEAPAQPKPAAEPEAPAKPTTTPSAPTPAPAPAPVSFGAGEDETLVPWTQMRKGVANAMVRSTTTVPHAYTTVEVDMTGVVRLRESAQRSFKEREGMGLSYVPFVVKATVEALRKHQAINAHWSEDGLVVKRRVGVGIAIAVENGLIVPVIHDADALSIAGLNRAVQDLATRARANKLKVDDLSGGTITVNNTGWFGSVSSQSIVNTPQVSIVNLEAIVKRPVVREVDGQDAIVIRSMMNLGAAFDHRATDGAQIGRFVADIKAWLESVGKDTPLF